MAYFPFIFSITLIFKTFVAVAVPSTDLDTREWLFFFCLIDGLRTRGRHEIVSFPAPCSISACSAPLRPHGAGLPPPRQHFHCFPRGHGAPSRRCRGGRQDLPNTRASCDASTALTPRPSTTRGLGHQPRHPGLWWTPTASCEHAVWGETEDWAATSQA